MIVDATNVTVAARPGDKIQPPTAARPAIVIRENTHQTTELPGSL
jgi:hypothetical protein